MSLDIKGNIITSADITSVGVFKTKVNRDLMVTGLDAGHLDSYVGSGTSWVDLSGNGNGATVSEFSYITDYDGVFENSTTRTGAVGMPYTLTNFPKLIGSLEIWARPTSWTGANGLFVNRDDDTPNAYDWLWLGPYGGGSTLYFRLGSGSDCCSNDNSIGSWSAIHSLNTWGQYFVTWESGYYSRVYFNGVLLQSVKISTLPATNPSSNGRIGLGHSSSNSMWIGQIGIFNVYSRVLNPYEISENFQAQRGRFGI